MKVNSVKVTFDEMYTQYNLSFMGGVIHCFFKIFYWLQD